VLCFYLNTESAKINVKIHLLFNDNAKIKLFIRDKILQVSNRIFLSKIPTVDQDFNKLRDF